MTRRKLKALIKQGEDYYDNGDLNEARRIFEEVLTIDPTQQEAKDWLRDVGGEYEVQEKFTEAAEIYAKLIDLDDQSAEGYNSLGRMLAAQGKYEEAVEKLQKSIQIDPNDSLFSQDLAVTYEQWGKHLLDQKSYSDANDKFNKAIEADLQSKEYSYREWGWALEQQVDNPKRFEEAAEKYAKAVEANPKYSDAYYDWGSVLLEQAKYDEAFEKFNKTLEIAPNYGKAYYGLSRVLQEQSKYGDAIEKLQKAIEFDKENEHVYYRDWGWALEQQIDNPKRFEEAERIYAKVLEVNKDHVAVYGDLGRVLAEQKKFRDAIEKLQKAIELDFENRHIYYRDWGWALEQQTDNPKRYEEAEKIYAQAVEANANFSDAYNDLGRVLLAQKKTTQAIDNFKKAAEIASPSQHIYYRNWGWALEQQEENNKRLEQAAEKYAQAVDVKPDYGDAFLDWGWVLKNQKKYDEAISKFKKSIESYKDSEILYLGYNGLGSVYIELQRYREAEDCFEKVIGLNTTTGLGYHNLAYLYERLGRYRKAQKVWKEALDRYLLVKEDERTDSDWSSIGQIYMFTLHNHMQAMKALLEGLKRYPENRNILFYILRLNLVLKDRYNYENPEDLEHIGMAHWAAFDAYKKIRESLESIYATGKSAYVCLDLGDLYNFMEEYDEAEKYLMEAVELDETLQEAYNLLGVIKTRKEDYKGAIEDFKKALKYKPNDFEIRSNLAEAYLRSNMLYQAEYEFRNILLVAPTHIDSLIGLAGTYTAMGEAINEGSRMGDAEIMFQQAIDLYDTVIRLVENKEIYVDASKRLTTKELNAVYYSRGYAQTNLYDAQANKDNRLLSRAQSDFRRLQYKGDSNYYKARRALKKISERLSPLSIQKIEQRGAPMLVSALALLIFIINLFVFAKGVPTQSPSTFSLTKDALDVLKAANAPEEDLVKLSNLVGKEFTTQDGLLAAVQLSIGDENFSKYKDLLSSQRLEFSTGKIVWKPIEVGYFTLMAFGSLIFIVAGLYLQQISKFKFGTIEIEKSPVNQISSSIGLGLKPQSPEIGRK
jgi:tetratricopeptide (TPR) repeat protein